MNANSSKANKIIIAKWLFETMKQLGDAGVDSPRRDALVLLEDTLQKDRAWVLAHPEYELGTHELTAVQKLVQQRLNRVPLAYIRDKAWFFNRFFEVNEHTLIPRPESESFIELLLSMPSTKYRLPNTVIDIGTGTGALGITAKLELPNVDVVATDISAEALTVAKNNAHRHDVNIDFLLGSLLEPLKPQHLDNSAIIANLPYVPVGLTTSPEITKEPAEALFSGSDGLDHYRLFWQQVSLLPVKPKIILTESLETQHQANAELAKKAGYTSYKTDILVQLFVPDTGKPNTK